MTYRHQQWVCMSLSTSNSISLFLREPANHVLTPAMGVHVRIHQQQHQVVFAGTCKSRLDTSNGCACPCPPSTVSARFCGNLHMTYKHQQRLCVFLSTSNQTSFFSFCFSLYWNLHILCKHQQQKCMSLSTSNGISCACMSLVVNQQRVFAGTCTTCIDTSD